MGIDGALSRRAAFLDRDGVINRAIIREGRPYPPASLAELEILPGVAHALARLRAAGMLLIVVSNQPDVARGTTARATVDEINARLATLLPLDAIRCCFHDSADGCNCRKPRPGLIVDAAREFDIEVTRSWMVGDRWRDVEAGRAAGCRTIFIDYGYDEQRPPSFDHRATSLAGATDIILKEFE